MKRISFIHMIGLAAAGLFSSSLASRADGAVPTKLGKAPVGPLPTPVGGHRYGEIPSAVLDDQLLRMTQMELPPSVWLAPMPATRFGMFSDAGNRRVWKFTEEWAFPSAAGFDSEAFEKDLLSVRRDHPEVFDTVVREAIFQYWENAITHSPLLNRANHIATLQGAFDLVLVSGLEGRY